MNVKTFLLFCFVETDADSCRSLSDLVSVDHSIAQSAGGVVVQGLTPGHTHGRHVWMVQQKRVCCIMGGVGLEAECCAASQVA